MRVVIPVVVKLLAELFLQMVLSLVNLSLKAVARVVMHETGLCVFRRALHGGLLLNFMKVLQPWRSSCRRLELVLKHGKLQ